jgi:hypothetical protein
MHCAHNDWRLGTGGQRRRRHDGASRCGQPTSCYRRFHPLCELSLRIDLSTQSLPVHRRSAARSVHSRLKPSRVYRAHGHTPGARTAGQSSHNI